MLTINPDELISNEDTARELRVQTNTLTCWRALGRGPTFVKVGRQVFYRRADLAEWLGAQRRQPNARAAS
jgi:hypothetical protein